MMKLRLVTMILLGALLTGCAQNTETTVEASQTEGMISTEEVSQSEAQAEEPYVVSFEANTIEGEAFSSDVFSQSRLTMINVWATYCNPCLSEMPDLGEIAVEFDSAEFQMIGVISDVEEGAAEDHIANAKELIEQTKANYPHLLLSESLYTNLVGGINSVPTTFFVDQKGELLGYVMGAQSKETWVSIIEELLSKCD
ncbi:MAG: TlpA family protein disulfide reductase [Lachnospiraceae bacterium]|nr:TlpA family protein disulfide reductase [Lachnospiraceae bacterium]